MKKADRLQKGELKAAAAGLLALALSSCSNGGPAPVVKGDAGPPPPTQIIVQRGQTLSGIAHSYRIPMSTLAEANHLLPPYRIIVGQALIIPSESIPSESIPSEASPYSSTLSTAGPSSPNRTVSLAPPYDSSRGATAPLISPAPESERTAHLTPPPNPTMETRHPARASEANSTALPSSSPGPSSTARPAPRSPATQAVASISPAHPTSEAKDRAAAEAPASSAHGGKDFLWPVHGRVLAGFGAGASGEHNDGINIAAPRGAAIEAADGGIVAYSGNELRGYGNLILIKHPNGWISAYAHCDLILVKAGQKVTRGQVIGRVGATGNVSEPQLHFELRRGKKPVDPRAHLPPLSAAITKEADPG